MTIESFTTTVGSNENGLFFGDGDCRIQFSHQEIDALQLATAHGQALADAFANYCTMTFASGEIPTCFRHDLSSEEINDIKEELPLFRKHFPHALFGLMLLFEF